MQDLLQRLRAMRSEKKNEGGFTLIELLVVVVIIGILIAIAIPLYLNYENGAKNKSSASDLRAAVSAVEQCYTDNNNTYPASFTLTTSTTDKPCTGQRLTLSSGSTLVYNLSGSYYSIASYQGAAPTGTAVWYCYTSQTGGAVVTKTGGYASTYLASC